MSGPAAGGAVVVINLNPSARERRGARRIVRALQRLVADPVSVLERHFRRVTPGSLRAIGARAVVFGPQGVPFDAYPEGEREQMFALIRDVARPALGICGGHQALVLAYGGRIAPLDGGRARGSYAGRLKQRGLRVVRLEPAAGDALVSRLPAEGRYFVSHVEAAVDWPSQVEVLGSSDYCAAQLVRIRDTVAPAYGVQFHPELGGDGVHVLRAFLSVAGVPSHRPTAVYSSGDAAGRRGGDRV